nr:GDP-mannose 4,6-dehydratase [Paenibacillus larvae]
MLMAIHAWRQACRLCTASADKSQLVRARKLAGYRPYYLRGRQGRGRLRQALADADADIVIHMAAQPLVRESYQDPVYTYQTNIMGTVHLLEAVRHLNTKGPTRTKSIINVTTDKCYDNREWIWGYRENDPLTPTPAAKHVPSLSRQLTAIPIFIRLNTISIKSVLQRRGQATLSEG